MSDDVTGRKYSEEEQQALRQRLLDLKAAENLTWKRLGSVIGVAEGTLSPWAGGNYGADGSTTAEKVERWLASREKHLAIRAAAPDLRFVLTPSASDFLAVLSNAQALAHMSVITGAPGIGKSRAACEYKRTHPKVFKVIASRFMSTVPQLLGALAKEMGLPDTGRQDRIANLIIRKMAGSNGLIILDEAQQLTQDQLEALRSIHDIAGVGLALIGNPSVMRKLEGGHRSADFAQLYSRVGMRLNRPRAKKGDLDALLDAWSVDETDVREMLHAVARQGGALRTAYMVFMAAHQVASHESRSLSPKHIELAWKQISDQDLPKSDAA